MPNRLTWLWIFPKLSFLPLPSLPFDENKNKLVFSLFIWVFLCLQNYYYSLTKKEKNIIKFQTPTETQLHKPWHWHVCRQNWVWWEEWELKAFKAFPFKGQSISSVKFIIQMWMKKKWRICFQISIEILFLVLLSIGVWPKFIFHFITNLVINNSNRMGNGLWVTSCYWNSSSITFASLTTASDVSPLFHYCCTILALLLTLK